jgi:hypothetical protein
MRRNAQRTAAYEPNVGLCPIGVGVTKSSPQRDRLSLASVSAAGTNGPRENPAFADVLRQFGCVTAS